MPRKTPNALLGLLTLTSTTIAQLEGFEIVEFSPHGMGRDFNSDSSLGNLTWTVIPYQRTSFAQGYNATATAQIKAYNMSQEYPGSALPDSQSWVYSIKVKEFLPNDNDEMNNDVEVPLSASWLQVETPKSNLVPSAFNVSVLEIPQHPSWQICSVFYVSRYWTQDTPIPGPGCTGFLSQDCIDEMKTNLEEAYKTPTDILGNRVYNQCLLPFTSLLPRRCHPRGGGVVGMGGALEQLRDPHPLMNRGPDGIYNWNTFVHFGNDTVDSLKQAVSQVYVIGHIWGYNGSLGGPTREFREVPGAKAEVTCLKAEIVEGGVVDKPDSEDEDNDGGEGNGSEIGEGTPSDDEDLGNPFRDSAAMSLGLSTEFFCKLGLAAVAACLFSL